MQPSKHSVRWEVPLFIQWSILGVVTTGIFLAIDAGCKPAYSAEDLAGDLASEADCAHIYAHNDNDAGDGFDRSMARACLCAVGKNLRRHDAGQIQSTAGCYENRQK